MTKLLAILFFCATLSVSAQEKLKTPVENLQQAIKFLESEFPEGGISYPVDSPLSRKAEKKQQEIMEIQNRLAAIQLIQQVIKALEAEKQRIRVVPQIPFHD